MTIPDAATFIGIGVSLFGLGTAVHLSVEAWLRVKRFERDQQARTPAPDADLPARLARIEQIVELTAIEIERVAEGQRYVARVVAEQSAAALPRPREPGRVVTPH